MSDEPQDPSTRDKLARERTEKARERTDKAEERSDMAEDRTLLANERTFAGWCRTGFAAIGLGLGFQALLRRAEPVWVVKSVATIFILLGVWIIWKAERRAARLLDTEDANHVRITHSKSFRGIAISVSVGAALLLVAMWWLV